MPGGGLVQEIRRETRLEAIPAFLLVVLGQTALAVESRQSGWSLSGLPWWHWLVPAVLELGLVTLLWVPATAQQLRERGHRRKVAMLLIAVVTVANAVSLGALLASLVNGHETNGAELLLKGFTIWATNVVAFGLWFWELDGGGPFGREPLEPGAPVPIGRDFQFPQMENRELAPPGWHPRLLDYVYIAFTNSIAFSPTDAMPLTGRAKALMLIESATSALTVLLVAARAVNILR